MHMHMRSCTRAVCCDPFCLKKKKKKSSLHFFLVLMRNEREVAFFARTAAKGRPTMCRTPEKTAPPPFPLRTVGLLLLITLSDSIVITFLMPMVPFMVRNYGVDEKDVGFSAGSLASAYNLAGLFSGFFWGRISDTYGRRPVLLFGLLSTGATVVWFGLAGSLSSAITARVVGGLLNSNQAVTRAMLREVTPEAHRARAFASVGQAWRRRSPSPPSAQPTHPDPRPHPHPRARPRTHTFTVIRRGASVSSLVHWLVGCSRAPPTRCPSCAARSSTRLRTRRSYPNL